MKYVPLKVWNAKPQDCKGECTDCKIVITASSFGRTLLDFGAFAVVILHLPTAACPNYASAFYCLF